MQPLLDAELSKMLCANCHMIRHHVGKEGVDATTH